MLIAVALDEGIEPIELGLVLAREPVLENVDEQPAPSPFDLRLELFVECLPHV